MFHGSIPALVTFFKDNELDLSAMKALTKHVVAGGSSAVLACGCTGEAAVLSDYEREAIFNAVKETVDGAVPVILGTGTNATDQSIKRTRWAHSVGADAALVITPYYNKPTQQGLFEHFRHIAESCDIPLILYNVPSRTGVSISPETVARLNEFPSIVTIKEASGSLDQVTAIRRLCDITVLSGDDSLTLPMLAVGATGVISVAANVAPRDVAQMIANFAAGNLKEAQRLHLALFPLIRSLFIETNPCPVKKALAFMGMGTGELRLPLVPVSEQSAHSIKKALIEYGILQG